MIETFIAEQLDAGRSYREVSRALAGVGVSLSRQGVLNRARAIGVRSKNRRAFDGWDDDVLWLREWLEDTPHGRAFMAQVAATRTA